MDHTVGTQARPRPAGTPGEVSGHSDAVSDAEILLAADIFIGGRAAGQVLHAHYHRTLSSVDANLEALAALLPIEQIAAALLVDRLNVADLPSVAILLAILSKIRTNDAWIHFALCKYLNGLIGTGVLEARLPVIVHSLLALEGLKDNTPNAKPLPLGVLARELTAFAPREAIKSGMLALRHGSTTGLHDTAPAFSGLGLEGLSGLPMMSQTLRIARELHLSADNIPRSTSLATAAGLRSTVVEQPRRIAFPMVRGDSSHYIFAQSGGEANLPGVAVHAFEGGTFSIDAESPGLEQHYVFDRNEHCVHELASGVDPFIAETVLECDEPVAILDDRFSGVMNICHFLLDRLTRIPIYERAWSRPGKFVTIDDFPYYREIFARIGLADRVIVTPAKRVTIRAPEILFSSNIAADFRHPAHSCANWAIDHLRHVLDVVDRPARRGHKVVISRGDAKARAVLNWQDLLPVFHRHDFEVVELSTLSVEAQIALFREAAQVVAVHGAGLTNILFAPRDCAVLEILPPLVATQAYWLLASRLGQRYTAMIADDAELPRPDYRTWQHNAVYNGRPLFIPVARLEAALASL